jgi:hypothetical protein
MKTRFRLLIFALLTAFFCPNVANGQTIKWAKSAGKFSDDSSFKTIFDTNGNNYTAGYFGEGGQWESFISPGKGFFVVKNNKRGEVMWAKFSRGTTPTYPNGLATDSKGNIYVTGTFLNALDLGDTTLFGGTQGTRALFFVKYDSIGKLIWARSLCQTAFLLGGHVAVDKNDNVYLTGEYIFTIDLGNNIILTGSHVTFSLITDAFICKFNAAGIAQWGRSFSSSLYDVSLGIKIGADENIYVIGEAGSGDLISEGTNYALENDGSSFLLKCDTDGHVLNFLPVDANVSDFSTTANNKVVLTGQGFNPTQPAYTGNFVTQLASDWRVEWTRHLFADSNWDSKIATYGSDIYVGGSFSGEMKTDALMFKSVGLRDVFLIKLDEAGVVAWGKQISDGKIDNLSSLAVLTKDHIAICGVYNGVLNLDGIILENNPGSDNADVFIAVLKDSISAQHTVCPLLNRPALTTSNAVICEGEASILSTVTHKANLTWYRNKTLVKSDTSSSYSVKIAGDYFNVIYAGAACSDTSNIVSVQVMKLSDTTITVMPGDVTCENQPVTLQAAGNYSYQWIRNDMQLKQETMAVLTTRESGMYYCTITHNGNCTSNTATYSIDILPHEDDFLPDTLFRCSQEEIILAPADLHSNSWHFEWATQDTSKSVSVNSAGVYVLKIHKGECTYRDSVLVKDRVAPWFPNVITPDGDDKNQHFVVRNLVNPVALSVYNRWGALVYEDNEYANNWSADALENGLFYFILHDHSGCWKKNFSGWLHVIR